MFGSIVMVVGAIMQAFSVNGKNKWVAQDSISANYRQ